MKFVTFVESGLTRAGVLVGDATRPTDIVVDRVLSAGNGRT